MKQVFKGAELTRKVCVNAIVRFYEQASVSELQDGMNWYKEANVYARELAARFNITLPQSAGILAAFSPQASWIDNKRYAVSFLLNNYFTLRTQVQCDKARNILTLDSEDKIYHALATGDAAYKTKSFYLNILNPDLVTSCTIDRHAIAICLQRPNNVYALDASYSKLTKAQYLFFVDCYTLAAHKLGILPQQLQAITWVTYRRIRSLKADDNAGEWTPLLPTMKTYFKP